jgi:hypothetical protein
MLGAFQVVGFFVNYINDKLQGERAQQALRQAASQSPNGRLPRPAMAP